MASSSSARARSALIVPLSQRLLSPSIRLVSRSAAACGSRSTRTSPPAWARSIAAATSRFQDSVHVAQRLPQLHLEDGRRAELAPRRGVLAHELALAELEHEHLHEPLSRRRGFVDRILGVGGRPRVDELERLPEEAGAVGEVVVDQPERDARLLRDLLHAQPAHAAPRNRAARRLEYRGLPVGHDAHTVSADRGTGRWTTLRLD
jgi:hypothetical protein